MTFDDVRKITLAWPEVEDGTSYGTPALKVRKKMLVRLKEDGDSLVMPGVPKDEREMLVESQPKVFYFTDHYRDYPMALIRLSKAKHATVEPLLRRQWRGAGVEEGGCRGCAPSTRSPDAAKLNPGRLQPDRLSRIALRFIRATGWLHAGHTPEVNPAFLRGGLMSFFRKQCASLPA